MTKLLELKITVSIDAPNAGDDELDLIVEKLERRADEVKNLVNSYLKSANAGDPRITIAFDGF